MKHVILLWPIMQPLLRTHAMIFPFHTAEVYSTSAFKYAFCWAFCSWFLTGILLGESSVLSKHIKRTRLILTGEIKNIIWESGHTPHTVGRGGIPSKVTMEKRKFLQEAMWVYRNRMPAQCGENLSLVENGHGDNGIYKVWKVWRDVRISVLTDIGYTRKISSTMTSDHISPCF